jgi:hypothetical protein
MIQSTDSNTEKGDDDYPNKHKARASSVSYISPIRPDKVRVRFGDPALGVRHHCHWVVASVHQLRKSLFRFVAAELRTW